MEGDQSELESEFPEEFGFGLFDDFPAGAMHPLMIDDYEDEVELRCKLKQRGANIYTPMKGSTQLHRAIRRGDEFKIKLLIDAYQEDFEKVGRYLEKEYGWDLADRVWLWKTILVANSEDECRVPSFVKRCLYCYNTRWTTKKWRYFIQMNQRDYQLFS